jgi:hypothetical protein
MATEIPATIIATKQTENIVRQILPSILKNCFAPLSFFIADKLS